jgi:hypothetical protein
MSDPHDHASEPDPAGLLLQISLGVRLERALYVAARLGVADLLSDGPRPIRDLAEELGADSGALYRVLRALAGLGIFQELDPGRFGLTPAAAPLRTDAPNSVRASIVQHGAEPEWAAWGAVLHTVKTGEPAFEHVWGESPWDYYGETRDRMTDISRQDSLRLADHPVFACQGRVVDVAGGEGDFLAAVLAANPEASGTLLDRPEIVETARSLLAEAGVDGRCEVVGGDMFESVPGGGDLYLLKRALHDWNDEKAGRILANIRSAMSPAARLVIVTGLVSDANQPSVMKIADLALMVMLGGRQRTEEEFRGLLAAAGLRLVRVISLPSALSAVEAEIA